MWENSNRYPCARSVSTFRFRSVPPRRRSPAPPKKEGTRCAVSTIRFSDDDDARASSSSENRMVETAQRVPSFLGGAGERRRGGTDRNLKVETDRAHG